MLSALLVALSQIGSRRDATTWTIFGVMLALAGLLFYLFLRHEKRTKDPIIDTEVLKGKPFQASNYFNMMYGAAVLGVMSFIPLFATSVLGMTTLASGLILTPRSVGQVLSSLITSMRLPKWGYRWPMLVGTVLVIIALILLGFEFAGFNIPGFNISGPVLLGILMFITGVGSGAVAPAANNACIELMPHRVATITGVRGMFRQIGAALSIAVTAMILENFSYDTGFRIVFFGLAAVLLLSIPFIFAMPRSSRDTGPLEKKTIIS
jgi:MFS family permease